jgi:hypothetical protein
MIDRPAGRAAAAFRTAQKNRARFARDAEIVPTGEITVEPLPHTTDLVQNLRLCAGTGKTAANWRLLRDYREKILKSLGLLKFCVKELEKTCNRMCR